MREVLITAAPFLVWFLAITELGLEVFSVMRAKRTLNVLSAMVCFGLAVDALIQALGVWIGEGDFLRSLSQIRYILHGVLVPLLIPIAFYTYGNRQHGSQFPADHGGGRHYGVLFRL